MHMALQSSTPPQNDPTSQKEETQFEQPKSNSLLLVLGIVALLVVVGFSVYLNLQKQALVEAHQKVQEENTQLNQEIETLESSKVKVTQQAQQWLTTIEQEEILWSSVLNRLQSLIPFDAVSKRAKITFVSYSGTSTGILSLNAQTRATSEAPFEDVSELIKSLNESSYFTRAVVPTITRGETDTGEEFLTFTLNVRYEEQELTDSTVPAVSPNDSTSTDTTDTTSSDTTDAASSDISSGNTSSGNTSSGNSSSGGTPRPAVNPNTP